MNIVMKIKTGEIDEFELLENITNNAFDVALATAESPLASSNILKIAVGVKDERIQIEIIERVKELWRRKMRSLIWKKNQTKTLWNYLILISILIWMN